MLTCKRILMACGVAAVTMAGTAAVHAWDDPSRTNYITVNSPFALPGVALPAGTYIFQLVDSESNLNLVRVMSRDRLHVYFTAFTNEVRRPAHRKLESLLSFGEFRKGMTPPVKVWYPAGATIGHEFIYPAKSQQVAR